MGCLPTKLNSVSDNKLVSDYVNSDHSKNSKGKTRSSSEEGLSPTMDPVESTSDSKRSSRSMRSSKESSSKTKDRAEEKSKKTSKENKENRDSNSSSTNKTKTKNLESKDTKPRETRDREREREKHRELKEHSRTTLKSEQRTDKTRNTDEHRSSRSRDVEKPSKERTSASDKGVKESKVLTENHVSKSDSAKIKGDNDRSVKDKPVLEKKGSSSKSTDKPIKNKPVVNKLPVVSKNDFDDKPLTGKTNAATKSWWEIDEANDSRSIGSFESYKPNDPGASRLSSNKAAQMPGDSGRRGEQDYSNQPNDGMDDYNHGRPSYNKTISSENINDVGLEKRSNKLNSTTSSNTSTRNDRFSTSNKNFRPILDAPKVRKGYGRNDDHFDTLMDDRFDDPYKNNPPSSRGYSNRANDSGLEQDAHKSFDRGLNNSNRINDERGSYNVDDRNQDEYNDRDGPSNDVRNTRFQRPPSARNSGEDKNFALPPPPARFSQNRDDMDSRPTPIARAGFGGNSPIQGGFSRGGDDDRFNSPDTLPPGPTNVPARTLLQDDGDVHTSPTGYTPRPKFKRPAPLKRGAGMLNRKVAPLVKSPKEVATSVLTRISVLEDSKFNDHLKLQKELIELMVKSPDVLLEMDTDALIKTAKKIIEVGGSNRTNLSRSSMICLGHMFEIIGSSLGGIVVDTLTLCAKKGVANASELLVSSANFCFARICTKASEPKVASQLVSLYRNNKAYQIITLSGASVLLNRMGPDMLKLKNLDQIVDISIKGMTSGGVAARTVTRNILGMVQNLGKLDHYLNVCRCTEIQKMTLMQNLKKYDDDSKDLFIEGFIKPLSL